MVEFLPEADEELREAARYYESEAPGLGMVFIVEVHKAVAHIEEFPLATQIVRRNIRKTALRTFPYILLYSIEHEQIAIIAVAHQRRRPNYWRRRLKPA